MRTKNLIYAILIAILFAATVQCCAKKQAPKEVSVELGTPETDSDADGVVDYLEVEVQSPPVSESQTMILDGVGVQPTERATRSSMNTIIADSIRVQKYELGRIVYDIPKEMEKLKTYTIQINIARDTLDLKIYDGMNVTVDTIIRTSSVMRVELSDPTGEFFRIVTKNEQQFIDIDEHTTWLFYVTPLKSGNSELVLSVSIMKDGNIKQTTYKDSVNVKTSTGLEIKLWLEQYWQWAFGIFIIPLFALLKKKYHTFKNKS